MFKSKERLSLDYFITQPQKIISMLIYVKDWSGSCQNEKKTPNPL